MLARRAPLRRRTRLRGRRPLRTSPRRRRVRAETEFVCLHCGAPFHRVPRRRGETPRFCSRRCARLHREALAATRDAPGVTEHSHTWWRRLRRYVLARDGFRCVLCGASERDIGRPLHVDHVCPRRAFPRAFEAYERFGTRAFVSLCPSCHARKTAGAETAWLRGDALRLLEYAQAVSLETPP